MDIRSPGEEDHLWVGERNERVINIYEKMEFIKLYQWGIWIRMLPALDFSTYGFSQIPTVQKNHWLWLEVNILSYY